MNEPMGHWSDLMPPPTLEQAMSAGRSVIDYFRSGAGDKVKVMYASGVVYLYGVAQLPHDHPLMFAGDAAMEDPVAALESALAPSPDGTMKAIPWLTILTAILKIIELLKNR